MSPSLPDRPNLEWLRKTAKQRLQALRAGRPSARLADAHLAIAREYGFSNWRALVAHVEALSTPAPPARLEVSLTDEVISRFLQLVGEGRLDGVRQVLAAVPQLVNMNGPHPFWGGRPQPLHVAIETTRREMVDLLLNAGADVNGVNEPYDHWSPLMLAIDRNQPAIQAELRRRGATLGLLEALLLEDDGLVEAQLREHGLPSITPNAGSILAFARTPFAIDTLIALGVPTDVRDRWGAAPIEAMSRLGLRGQVLVRHLIARGVAAQPEEYARLDDLATLERLVESDPSIASRDAVLMGAVDFRHHALVAWLLARGANVAARAHAQSRHTALHSAAWNGDLEMVRCC